MINYLKYKWFEWKRGNEVMRVDMNIRNYPKARDDHFNRYAAIAYAVLEMERYGILHHPSELNVDKDGMWIICSIKRKHFHKFLEIAGRVK